MTTEKLRPKNGELWQCGLVVNLVLDEDAGLVLSVPDSDSLDRKQTKLFKLFKPCPRCEKIA